MSIVIFVIVLVVLIIVHELGHFIAAKIAGIRVDEFGLGFPPRIVGIKKGETVYSLNWIPFGGFVKIFGENPDTDSMTGNDSTRSMFNAPRWIQAIVLVAGISFNIIFAWLLISFGFMTGLPASVAAYPNLPVQNPHVVLTSISPGSPAEKAGLKVGDVITSLSTGGKTLPMNEVEDVQNFIGGSDGMSIAVSYERGTQDKTVSLTPSDSIVPGKPVIGITMDKIGTLHLSLFRALWEGAKLTVDLVWNVAVGLASFLKDIFTFHANFSQVTGPIGIIGLVGDASQLGFIYLLSFTAFISINLAVINLLPFPALDGGRLLFVLIEAIKRSPIKPKVANTINTVGFFLLIGLMLVITAHDIFKLFH